MTSPASRRMRSARNALAEALGLGEPWPLVDLPVAVAPPVVPFGGRGRISIEDAEAGVTYRLMGPEGAALPGRPLERDGTGGLLEMDTPVVEEDAAYALRATRPSGRQALLAMRASVRVGLDRTLAVAFDPPSEGPAIVDHGARITLAVAASQEGVRYGLVARPDPDPDAAEDPAALARDVPLSPPDGVPGTGGPLRLDSDPLTADQLVRVRAVKRFAGAPPRPDQTMLLDAVVPVFVRARADPMPLAEPAIADHGAPRQVQLSGAEAGISYQLFAAPVADRQFDRATPPAPGALHLPAPGGGDISVLPPSDLPPHAAPAGYLPVGEPQTASGAELLLPLPPAARDELVLLVADKAHAGGVTSRQRLQAPLLLLTRPNPAPPVVLIATLTDDGLVHVALAGGEPGVFVQLKSGGFAASLYAHQPDPVDRARNKGIDQLAIAVDFVVAPGPPSLDTANAPPPAAWLDLKALPLPAELALVARRAMTGFETDLGIHPLRPLPPVALSAPAVAPGGAVTLTIETPEPGHRHQLLLNGKPLGEPLAGDAGPLSFDTGPLPADATLMLEVVPEAESAVRIIRRQLLPLKVAP